MFYKYLKDNKLEFMVNPPKFVKMLPARTHKVYLEIMKAIAAREHIIVVPDPDPDGFFSAKCWDYTFRKIGYGNYSIVKLTHRVHKVDPFLVKQFFTEGPQSIIVVDSSTNDLDLIDMLCHYVERLIIVDHHECPYTMDKYPSKCTVVNPCMEASWLPYRGFSAGALNSLVCDYILTQCGFQDNQELYVYGYITLYSDQCTLENHMTVSYMRRMLKDDNTVPQIISFFWDQYSSITRNWVNFKVVPIINAMIRCGRFDLIDKLFFRLHEVDSWEQFREEILGVQKESRRRLEFLMNAMEITNTESIVIGIVPGNLDPLYYNFNGLVAQKLATEYGKPSLCLHFNEDTKDYTGSARDPLGRDLLKETSTFIEAAGHDAAFGVRIPANKLTILPEFLCQVELEEKNKYIIFEYADLTSSREIQDIAIYNEYAGFELPKVRIRCRLSGDFRIRGSERKSIATSNSLTIVRFGEMLVRYEEVIAEPSFNGDSIECVVRE